MEQAHAEAWRLSQQAHFVAARLLPGTDVRLALSAWARSQTIGAAVVLSAVGSLRHATLRFAGQAQGTELDGPWEILSLSGTLGAGGLHLHIGLADRNGSCRGGHLLAGCIVATTLEITLAVLPALQFSREQDPATGYAELQVRQLVLPPAP